MNPPEEASVELFGGGNFIENAVLQKTDEELMEGVVSRTPELHCGSPYIFMDNIYFLETVSATGNNKLKVILGKNYPNYSIPWVYGGRSYEGTREL